MMKSDHNSNSSIVPLSRYWELGKIRAMTEDLPEDALDQAGKFEVVAAMNMLHWSCFNCDRVYDLSDLDSEFATSGWIHEAAERMKRLGWEIPSPIDGQKFCLEAFCPECAPSANKDSRL